MLVSLFSQCMGNNGWSVPDGKSDKDKAAAATATVGGPAAGSARCIAGPAASVVEGPTAERDKGRVQSRDLTLIRMRLRAPERQPVVQYFRHARQGLRPRMLASASKPRRKPRAQPPARPTHDPLHCPPAASNRLTMTSITCTRRIEFEAAHRVLKNHESKRKHLHGPSLRAGSEFCRQRACDSLGRHH